MKLFHLFSLLLAIIPAWLFFMLSQHHSGETLSEELLIEQSFAQGAARNYGKKALLPEGSLPYFHGDNYVAYFNNNASIIHQRFFPAEFYAYVGECCYLVHQTLGKNHTLYANNGEKLFDIEHNGFPLLSPSGSLMLFISTDGSSITLIDRTRRIYFENQFFDPRISAAVFSENDNSFALGSTRGKVAMYDFFGTEVFSADLTNHTHPIIKSLALSTADARILAVLSGKKPETLILFYEDTREKQSQLVKRWEVPTGENALEPTPLFIDILNGYVIRHSKETNAFALKRWELANGEVAGNFLSLQQLPGKINNVLYKSVKGYFLVALISRINTADAVSTNAKENSALYLFRASGPKLIWKVNLPDEALSQIELHAEFETLFVSTHGKQEKLLYKITPH